KLLPIHSSRLPPPNTAFLATTGNTARNAKLPGQKARILSCVSGRCFLGFEDEGKRIRLFRPELVLLVREAKEIGERSIGVSSAFMPEMHIIIDVIKQGFARKALLDKCRFCL